MPRAGVHPPNEWESGNPRFDGKNRSEISLMPSIGSGTDMAGSPPCQRTEICQGIHHFDRLFALPRPGDWASVPPPLSVPLFKTRILHDHLVSGNENRPALRPGRIGRDGLPGRGSGRRPAGSGPGQSRARQGQRRGDPPERRRACRRGTRRQPRPDGSGDQEGQRAGLPDRPEDRRQGRRGQEGRECRGLQEAPGVHAQPASDGQPAGHRGQGGDHRRGHEEGL